MDHKSIKKVKKRSWPPLLDYDFSFHEDGAVSGSSGMGGIGGVLRNAEGKVLCLFSSFVGCVYPIEAEIITIHKACMLISSCLWLEDRKIVIFSDSESAVSWINRVGFGLLSQVNLLYDIRHFIRQRGFLRVNYLSRDANSMADCLAKAGVHSQGERLEWSVS